MNRALVIVELRVIEQVDFGETETTTTRQVVLDAGDDLAEAQEWYDRMKDWRLDQAFQRADNRIMEALIRSEIQEELAAGERKRHGVEVLSLDEYEKKEPPNPFD